MFSIEEITQEIIKREGGFVNDPDDPGGATNYGVTIHTLRSLRGEATIEDVRKLTPKEAEEIYKKHYFYAPKIDKLPIPIQSSVYDMQVNAGRNAIKILQRLLAEFDEKVTVDGSLGSQSFGATQRTFDKAGEYLVDAYAIARRDYYFAIGDKRPTSRKYIVTQSGGKGGWIKRAEEFMRPKYHLSARAFKRRVALWA